MLMAVGTFIDRVETDLAGLIDNLSALTGRAGDYELAAWRRSLPKLSVLLNHSKLQDFHLQLGQPGGISLEYRLPVSSAWCDAVLLGQGAETPCAVMIELKDWDVTGDQPTERETLVWRHGQYWSHPSDQVRGYVDYCRFFHSTVLEEQASLAGCAFFTSARDLTIYTGDPYSDLVAEYPVFCSTEQDLQAAFPAFLSHHLIRPDYHFAQRFEAGVYAQDRNFLEQVARAILDDDHPDFVLLDEQRLGYEVCLQAVDDILAEAGDTQKAAVVIQGPPGSGKSVLAAKLWAALVRDPRISGKVVLTTTSSSQRANWQSKFELLAQRSAGKGIVVPSNKYNPGMTAGWLKRERNQGHALPVGDWRANYRHFLAGDNHNQAPDEMFEVSVVDEAHALINPAVSGREGVPSSGWFVQAGPQAWHIMRASRLTIFLLDSEQSYRDNETTTPEMLDIFASDLGVDLVQNVSLADGQFRCGGSKEYVAWLEGMLHLRTGNESGVAWRRTAQRRDGAFSFDLVADPAGLDDSLRVHLAQGRTARLVASYGRAWRTKGISRPHTLPGAEMDFHIPYTRDGQRHYWSRIWNFLPGAGKYDHFIQAPTGSLMQADPLCEVGCPYVVRGFDYDYLGVLWLSDLVWRDGTWAVDFDHIHETAWSLTLGRARKEHRKGWVGPETLELIRRLQRGYRILLSRAIYGVTVWIEDPETRQHVAEMLGE